MGITGVVLAGGQSKRMGEDKAFLNYKGKTFLRHILEEIDKFVDDIVISINKPVNLYENEIKNLKKPVKFVKDIDKFAGPLNGIVSCAESIKSDKFFLLTCDTPLFNGKLIPFFQSLLEDYDCVIPVIDGKYQFLNTIYSKKSLEVAKNLYLKEMKNSLYAWVKNLKVKYIEEKDIKNIDKNLGSYFSVNTPQQYKLLLENF